jgi:hypothetical protein
MPCRGSDGKLRCSFPPLPPPLEIASRFPHSHSLDDEDACPIQLHNRKEPSGHSTPILQAHPSMRICWHGNRKLCATAPSQKAKAQHGRMSLLSSRAGRGAAGHRDPVLNGAENARERSSSSHRQSPPLVSQPGEPVRRVAREPSSRKAGDILKAEPSVLPVLASAARQ